MNPKKETLAHLALLIVNLIFAIHYIVAPYAIKGFGAFGVVALRVSVTTLTLTLLFSLLKIEKIKKRAHFFRLLACAVFGIAINMLGFFKGLSITTAINASLLMIITPVFVLTVSFLLKKETLTLLKVFGIFSGFCGAFLLLSGKNFHFNTQTIVGDVYIIINALSYAIFLVIVKPLTRHYSALSITFWTFLFGSFINFPVGLPELLKVSCYQLELSHWIALVYVVFFATLIAYILNAWALQYLSSSQVGSYIYLQPILASFLAILLGTDEITFNKLISAILIIIGVYLVNRKY